MNVIDSALFDAAPYLAPEAPKTKDQMTTDQRRVVRQALQLAKGLHPITGARVHPQAAPHDDRAAGGYRCGTCRFRVVGGKYPKCRWPNPDEYRTLRLPRVTHGPATDVRAWWPACTDYEAVSDA